MVIKIKLRRGANYSKKIGCAVVSAGPQDLVENIKKAVEADGRSPAGETYRPSFGRGCTRRRFLRTSALCIAMR